MVISIERKQFLVTLLKLLMTMNKIRCVSDVLGTPFRYCWIIITSSKLRDFSQSVAKTNRKVFSKVADGIREIQKLISWLILHRFNFSAYQKWQLYRYLHDTAISSHFSLEGQTEILLKFINISPLFNIVKSIRNIARIHSTETKFKIFSLIFL